MAAPQPVAEDYTQPTIPPSNSGWTINSVDLQVVTKSDAWNQNQTNRNNDYLAIKTLGANYVSIAVPYDNATKYTNYVSDARSNGFKLYFRSHWNNWQGDNSTSPNLSKQSYLDQMYDFIVANPTLYQDNDLFGACVEPFAANNTPNTTYPFRVGNVSGGAWDYTQYNRFCRDQVTYANAAFKAIGKKVATWPISLGVTQLNLNGQTLDDGTTGNASGFGDAEVVAYFNSILSIDHYLNSNYRYSDSYWVKYGSDLDKIHTAFPSCEIMISEWGYPTNTNLPDYEQAGVYEQVEKILRTKSYIYGVNFWVHAGSSTASVFNYNVDIIDARGRQCVSAIRNAFLTGNSAYGQRVRV